ncbi:MAG: ABC transporter ATP-binding protein [bacterium]|nr:ABC transporter ATP-binding protein [bacterium]
MNIIEIKNISKIYKMGKVDIDALKNVSLQIKMGEFITIMGHSGSGKSTLLNIIGLLDRPTSGTYYFEDARIDNLNEDELATIRNKKIGFIFQTFNLLPQYSALFNVELPLVYSGCSPKRCREIALSLLKEVGLSGRERHKPNELSGGEQQRVAIARALVNDPMIILADEPTGNLDTKCGNEIMEIFALLHQEGKTILLVTHNEHITSFSQRIIYLQDGKIIEGKNL